MKIRNFVTFIIIMLASVSSYAQTFTASTEAIGIKTSEGFFTGTALTESFTVSKSGVWAIQGHQLVVADNYNSKHYLGGVAATYNFDKWFAKHTVIKPGVVSFTTQVAAGTVTSDLSKTHVGYLAAESINIHLSDSTQLSYRLGYDRNGSKNGFLITLGLRKYFNW